MVKNEIQIEKELLLIEKWYNIREMLVSHFSLLHSGKIKEREIFEALFILLAEKEKLEWIGSLWDINIEYEEALKLLSDFDFSTVLNKIETPDDFIPKKFLIEYKVRIKAKGQIWVIYKYDADSFPSNPHAHDLQNNIKLDLSNGNCYKVRNYIYAIKKKDLLLIRKKTKEIFKENLPELAI